MAKISPDSLTHIYCLGERNCSLAPGLVLHNVEYVRTKKTQLSALPTFVYTSTNEQALQQIDVH